MIKIFKKSTFLLLLLATLFCSVFFISCDRLSRPVFDSDIEVVESKHNNDRSLYYRYLAKNDIDLLTFYIHLYEADENGDNQKYIGKIKFEAGNVLENHYYTIEYTLSDEQFPQKNIYTSELEIDDGVAYF